MARDPDEPMAWIPGESDFANAQYLSRPAWWPTMTPEEAARAQAGQRFPVIIRGKKASPIADFLFDAPYNIE